MNQIKLDYYKESGIVNPLNLSLFLLCSFASILVLGYIYALTTTYLPFIYFNFLITVGYGFAVSFISRIFTLVFKIRNRKKTIIINLILAVFAIYAQWVSYIFILSFEDFNFNLIFENIGLFFFMFFRPDIVITSIIDINGFGLWSIGTSGINVRGIILCLVWLAEASIIIFIAHNNFRQFNLIPFSEKDNNWYKKEFIDFDFEHIAFKKSFVEDFSSNPFESISKLKKGDGIRHSKISLYKSETESKSIITIDNIIITQRGKGKKDVTNVLKLCYLDNLHVSQLRTKFRTKKASILDQ